MYPEKLEVYLKEWKRPETLLPDVPTVPVVLLKTPDGDGDDAAESAGDKGNRTLVDEHALYFGNPCVEWLFAAIRNVYERRDTVDAGSLLWENIYPRDDEGIPVASPNGKYLVRMWIMNAWRCVTVDDRVPVDVFGTSLLVGVRPLMLWPILLSKGDLETRRGTDASNAKPPTTSPSCSGSRAGSASVSAWTPRTGTSTTACGRRCDIRRSGARDGVSSRTVPARDTASRHRALRRSRRRETRASRCAGGDLPRTVRPRREHHVAPAHGARDGRSALLVRGEDDV